MTFIIATGGTGGHIYPALRVADELKSQGHTPLFLGSFNRSRNLESTGYSFEELGAKGLVITWRKEMYMSIAAMYKAFIKARRYLKKAKPDAILGFGGYGAFPGVMAAITLNIPTLIHEQNVVPGRANALLAKFVNRIAISFNNSSRYFNPSKTVVTGCPCHVPVKQLDKGEILKRLKLEPGRTTILVIGGSQGSRHINSIFVDTIGSLTSDINIQVIHISGKDDFSSLQSRYNSFGIPFALFEFLDKMEEAYHVADLVVSRSGAATVSEIAGFRLPAIFIPYPHARAHQKENASVLCQEQGAKIIEDQNLSTSVLRDAILDFIKAPQPTKIRTEVSRAICKPDAAARLAHEAIHLIS